MLHWVKSLQHFFLEHHQQLFQSGFGSLLSASTPRPGLAGPAGYCAAIRAIVSSWNTILPFAIFDAVIIIKIPIKNFYDRYRHKNLFICNALKS